MFESSEQVRHFLCLCWLVGAEGFSSDREVAASTSHRVMMKKKMMKGDGEEKVIWGFIALASGSSIYLMLK